MQAPQPLVSFRQTATVASSDGQSTRAERIAAALISSQGPADASENDNTSNLGASVLRDESGLTGGGMSQLEDARSKFLGGFSSLKSEIS